MRPPAWNGSSPGRPRVPLARQTARADGSRLRLQDEFAPGPIAHRTLEAPRRDREPDLTPCWGPVGIEPIGHDEISGRPQRPFAARARSRDPLAGRQEAIQRRIADRGRLHDVRAGVDEELRRIGPGNASRQIEGTNPGEPALHGQLGS
jgi:hypothetical protein